MITKTARVLTLEKRAGIDPISLFGSAYGFDALKNYLTKRILTNQSTDVGNYMLSRVLSDTPAESRSRAADIAAKVLDTNFGKMTDSLVEMHPHIVEQLRKSSPTGEVTLNQLKAVKHLLRGNFSKAVADDAGLETIVAIMRGVANSPSGSSFASRAFPATDIGSALDAIIADPARAARLRSTLSDMEKAYASNPLVKSIGSKLSKGITSKNLKYLTEHGSPNSPVNSLYRGVRDLVGLGSTVAADAGLGGELLAKRIRQSGIGNAADSNAVVHKARELFDKGMDTLFEEEGVNYLADNLLRGRTGKAKQSSVPAKFKVLDYLPEYGWVPEAKSRIYNSVGSYVTGKNNDFAYDVGQIIRKHYGDPVVSEALKNLNSGTVLRTGGHTPTLREYLDRVR